MKDRLIIGNIITMDSALPKAEAVVVRDGKIAFVGSRQDAEAFGVKDVLDFGSRTILPGFIDTHVHVIPAGIFMNGADLSKVSGIEDILNILREQASKTSKKEWVIGAFFQDKDIPEKRFPTREELDKIIPDKPLMICHNDLHPIALNSKALSILKVDPSKDGVRTDASGRLTGLIEDPACLDMLGDILVKLGIGNIVDGILRVDEYAAAHGVTTVFGKDVYDILLLREIFKDLFRCEFVPMWYSDGCENISSMQKILKNKKLRDRTCICAFADGAFDGHSAAVNEPYSDRNNTCGILNYTDKQMYDFTMAAREEGQQVSFHAIGDAAIDQVLRVYEKVLNDCPKEDHRLRIEHFEEPKPEAIAKAAKLKIALGMQPLLIEVCERMDFSGYEPFIGDRVKLCSPYRSVLDAGLIVGGGTDYPVTPMDVLHGARILMTHPVEEQRITLRECIEINTIQAAKLGFIEDRKGSISVNKDADLIILDKDPFSADLEELSDIKILKTFCKGRKVFDFESYDPGKIRKKQTLAGLIFKLISVKIFGKQ